MSFCDWREIWHITPSANNCVISIFFISWFLFSRIWLQYGMVLFMVTPRWFFVLLKYWQVCELSQAVKRQGYGLASLIFYKITFLPFWRFSSKDDIMNYYIHFFIEKFFGKKNLVLISWLMSSSRKHKLSC